jgi:hypothetical protein
MTPPTTLPPTALPTMSRSPPATKQLHIPNSLHNLSHVDCPHTTSCIHVPPTLDSNTTNTSLRLCHTSAPLDCPHSKIYTTIMQQHPAPSSTNCTYNHTNRKNPPEPHLLHLPLLPPFTHLPNQTRHSIPFRSPPIKPDNDNRDDTPSWPTKLAIRFDSPHGLANISHQALFHVIKLAFNAPPTYTIPHALSKSPNPVLHSIDIKEVCNGVLHPVIKETIKNTKLMNNLVLSPLWVPTMFKELHRLAQGKEGTTVATDTIFFSPMTKSGAPPRTPPSPTCALTLTICPRRMIPTVFASPLAET